MVHRSVLALALSGHGFSLAELLVVMAIISIVSATSVPWLITYWRAATTKAAAQELASGLNSARQLAVAKAQSVCFEVSGSQYRFRLGGCTGTIWTGPGSSADGLFRLANNIALTTNVNPVFDYLGAAVPGATLTVTNPQGSLSRTVVVSPSGRVQVQ